MTLTDEQGRALRIMATRTFVLLSLIGNRTGDKKKDRAASIARRGGRVMRELVALGLAKRSSDMKTQPSFRLTAQGRRTAASAITGKDTGGKHGEG